MSVASASRHSRIASLSGYMPALPTPFDRERDLDETAVERLCELQIRNGASALVVCGTTGESATLTLEEYRKIIRIAMKTARGRVPVIAGAGSNSTAHAIQLAKHAAAAGADALLSVTPYYNKPNQAGLVAHFMAIMNAVRLPLILYDIPSRTACGLSDTSIVHLAKHPQCAGLKDATGDVSRPSRLRPVVRPEFRLFSGEDSSALGFFAYGGDGCISVTSNVVPGLCQSMHLAFMRGQLALAQHLAVLIGKLTTAIFAETNPVGVKYALNLLGVMSDKVRLPLVEAGPEAKAKINEAVAELLEASPQSLIKKPIKQVA